MIGPIQLLAVQFEDVHNFRGEIQSELDRLRQNGLIRIVDLMFVARDENSRIVMLTDSDLTDAEVLEFGRVIGRMIGEDSVEAGAAVLSEALALAEESIGLSLTDVRELADDVAPGTAVGILLFEHTWAIGLQQAIRNAGGYALAQGFLTREALLLVGAELEAMVLAEQAIEEAEIIKGVALLDALATVVEAEEVKAAAVADALETVEQAAQLKAAIALDVLETLLAAGFVEQLATERALEALAAAELIERHALAAANDAVSQAEDVVEQAFRKAEGTGAGDAQEGVATG